MIRCEPSKGWRVGLEKLESPPSVIDPTGDPSTGSSVLETLPSRPKPLDPERARLAKQRAYSDPTAGVRAHRLHAASPQPDPGLADVRSGKRLVRSGDSGPEVGRLRRLLNAQGAKPPLAETGAFDANTKEAVKRFQKANGLLVDGIIGPETMGALDKARGIDPHPAAAEATARYARRRQKQSAGRPGDPSAVQDAPKPANAHAAKPTDAPQGPQQPGATVPANQPAAPGAAGGLRGPHGNTPARRLTKRQAVDELVALRRAGKIDFKPPNPKPGDRIRLKLPIDGVEFKYPTRRRPDRQTYPLDPRMAVAHVRLAGWAKSRGITQVEHLGYRGSGRGRHGEGRAMDIGGFRGVDPATGKSFYVNVKRDWGRAPKGNAQGYRLDPSTVAGRVFKDAYRFMASEFRDRRNGRSQIGDRSYVLTPDHPSARLARTHADHFHIEVPPSRRA